LADIWSIAARNVRQPDNHEQRTSFRTVFGIDREGRNDIFSYLASLKSNKNHIASLTAALAALSKSEITVILIC
jgi:hypothetical protein